MSAVAEPEWGVGADEISEHASTLASLAENVARGYLEAARSGEGFIFRMTDEGRRHVEQMGQQ